MGEDGDERADAAIDMEPEVLFSRQSRQGLQIVDGAGISGRSDHSGVRSSGAAKKAFTWSGMSCQTGRSRTSRKYPIASSTIRCDSLAELVLGIAALIKYNQPTDCRFALATLVKFNYVAQQETALKLPTRFAATLVLWAALLATTIAGADVMKSMSVIMPVTPKAAASPPEKAFAAAIKAMMKGMNVKPTGKLDKDFVLMMMPHQQGAIDMAKVELQYGTDPELRQLATDIVATQEKEITQMKDWLAKNGK
jgi:Domain of unknown function (DUF305)